VDNNLLWIALIHLIYSLKSFLYSNNPKSLMNICQNLEKCFLIKATFIIEYSMQTSTHVYIYIKNHILGVLLEYKEKIPFVKAAPIDEQEVKKQKKSGKKDKPKDVAEKMDKMAIGDN
jgi:hypothetical protein